MASKIDVKAAKAKHAHCHQQAIELQVLRKASNAYGAGSNKDDRLPKQFCHLWKWYLRGTLPTNQNNIQCTRNGDLASGHIHSYMAGISDLCISPRIPHRLDGAFRRTSCSSTAVGLSSALAARQRSMMSTTTRGASCGTLIGRSRRARG